MIANRSMAMIGIVISTFVINGVCCDCASSCMDASMDVVAVVVMLFARGCR